MRVCLISNQTWKWFELLYTANLRKASSLSLETAMPTVAHIIAMHTKLVETILAAFPPG